MKLLHSIGLFSTVLALATAAGASAPRDADSDASANAIVGEWLTQEGDAKVRVSEEQSTYIGRITWMATPNETDGQPRLDKNNPDASLRSRPILGLKIVWGLHPDAARTYRDGSVYDPKSGKTYSAKATLEGPDTLVLRGYVGVPLFGRSAKWTRVK